MTENTRRPTSYDDEVRTQVAELLWPSVEGWLKKNGEEDPDKEEFFPQLRRALDGTVDGYQIARHLDGEGWVPDVHLVDILDFALAHQMKAHKELVKRWVIQNGIKPLWAVGAKIKFKRRNEKFELVEVEGEVLKIDEEQATYLLFCESLGHVREGVGRHGSVIAYENVGG